MAESNYLGVSPAPFVAGGTIEQYRVVEFSAAPNVVTAANAIADLSLGVSLTSAASGDPVPCQVFGIAKVTASAAITAGAEVMVTASGAGKVETAAGATARSIGVALSAAGADGDVINVLLCLPTLKGPANS